MNKNKAENIFKLSSEERYHYFIRKICDFETVWILKDLKGSIPMLGEGNSECIPVWPEKEFSDLFLTDNWTDYRSVKIDLSDFIDWLTDLTTKNFKIAVFPRLDFKAVIINPLELIEHIENESGQYQ